MQSVSEIRPFDDRLEVYHLPASRIIGVKARSGGKLGNTAPRCGTEVPEGVTFRDRSETPCAKGLYGKDEATVLGLGEALP